MKIKEGFILREVAGTKVVVPIGEATLDFNGIMSLNDTGAFLFDKMIKGISREELICELVNEYGIDEQLATVDVDAFIKRVEGEDLFE